MQLKTNWSTGYTTPGLRYRPRRLRASKVIRDLVAESRLYPGDFVLPLFIKEGIREKRPMKSLEGHYYLPTNGDDLINYIQTAMDLKVKSFLLFGVTSIRNRMALKAYDRDGPVQVALKYIRNELGWEPLLFTDLCMCGYTDHGHCGVIRETRRGMQVDNDETLKVYARIAVSQAEAGSDFIAPSGMMDGQVAAIRDALDSNGFSDVGIMAYATKYASSFYGPFRDVVDSAPRFGDRRGYQMDPRNRFEALKEAAIDIEEGADIIMVKPALAYLDIISLVKAHYPFIPLAAYNVSGEYSMIKVASKEGIIDGRLAQLEVLTAIKRAGADIIITYSAMEVAEILRNGYTPF
ncbi:MAG: porphobilinogen synthase [Desulfurococcales archaeon]|nr:porphobilinogen synthase [Desulfurococcales archaeon]